MDKEQQQPPIDRVSKAADNADFDAEFRAGEYITKGQESAAEFGSGSDARAVALFAIVHALAFQHEFDIKARD